nr:nitrogenase component 1 [Methanoculleus sp.]
MTAGVICIRIAVYGKGGIGKSTISANVSAALAQDGLRVMQIGCDPKHDSTRLLIGGEVPTTVLEYIKNVLPEDRRLEEIVFKGYGAVACVEAGGPEPGVGCAGRGIITTFELLESLGIKSYSFDVSIYDVLGDVVCGGFAVPVRDEYADAVFIVTSGEYLSLYAANNILRGIQNFTGQTCKVAGIIHNARGLEEEDDRVTRFARAVRLPIVASIPRSEIFANAEKEGCTVIERYPASPEASIFRQIAGHIENIRSARSPVLYPALPLSDKKLEEIVLQREARGTVQKYDFSSFCVREAPGRHLSGSVKSKRPLIGCAFAGAVSVTAQITDVATIMHCPRSCLLMICEKLLDTEQRSATIFGQPYDPGLVNRLLSTDMTDEEFIFGGERILAETIESAIKKGFTHIFVVTACPPGIVGDNVGNVAKKVSEQYPGVQVIPVPVDGNLTGDFAQGVLDTYRMVAGLMPESKRVKECTSVNIVAEKWLALNDEESIGVVEGLLERLGVTVNCRFLRKCSFGSLLDFNNAALNLPADNDDASEGIRKTLTSVSGVPFLDRTLPVGFGETEAWLMAVAEFFGREALANEIIAEERDEYNRRIERLRPHLEGKTVLISTYPRSVDWICDLAEDLKMSIVKIGLTYSPISESFASRHAGTIPVEKNYTVDMRSEDIRTIRPDLVLYTYPVLKPHDQARGAHIPYCPGFGFHAAVERAELWSRLLKLPATEGWKKDGEGIL